MAKNFSREVADKLLDKLSHDDDFRSLFQSDPHAALAQLGHVTPAAEKGVEGADPVVCASSGKLASKAEIRAARDQLQGRLSSTIFAYDMAV
ncbi:MAG: NHLP-related RiPP peptide [Arenimonas sp.]